MKKEMVSKQKFIELLNEEIKKHAGYRKVPEVKDIGYDHKNQIYWHFHSPYDNSGEIEKLANEHSHVIEEALSRVEEEYEFQ